MELSAKDQVVDLIKKSNKILLLTHLNPDGDALGSLLGLYLALKNYGKEVTALCADPLPDSFAFLPLSNEITSELSGSRDFIVSLNCKETEADKLSYNLEDNKLNIVITPKSGQFKKEDVSFFYGAYKYDLIIVLDCQDLERLGILYEKNTQMFYETPLCNIDHHPGNEYFGQINLVDLTATSTAEILHPIIEGLEPKLIDEDVATSLLCGIITDTGSFQNSNTTPKSLSLSAQLVAQGARQQEIIKYIYRTKPLSTLKLWGKALAHIKYEPEYKFAWTSISQKDLAENKASPEETSGLIDELLSSVPEAELVLLLSEKKPNQIFGSLRSQKGTVDASAVALLFSGGGHPEASGFTLEGSLSKKEEEIINKIKDFLKGETKEIATAEEIEKLKAQTESFSQEQEIKISPPKVASKKEEPALKEQKVPKQTIKTPVLEEPTEFEDWIKKIREE